MIEVAVTTNIECAHYDTAGRVHGHSYVIEVWYPMGPDLPAAAAFVKAVAANVDHTTLEDSVGGASMEDIAKWFLTQTPESSKVVVRRPTLGYIVEARR